MDSKHSLLSFWVDVTREFAMLYTIFDTIFELKWSCYGWAACFLFCPRRTLSERPSLNCNSFVSSKAHTWPDEDHLEIDCLSTCYVLYATTRKGGSER